MPRLFTALTLPETIKETLKPLQADADLRGATWVPPAQWHITLHFIGDAAIPAAHEALSTVNAEPFTLRLADVGIFPPSGTPRILWAGVDAPDALHTLHERVGTALEAIDYVPETRPYTPHVTLARFKEKTPPQANLEAYRQQHAAFASEPFTIDEFVLYESQLTKQGAIYTVQHRYPLHI